MINLHIMELSSHYYAAMLVAFRVCIWAQNRFVNMFSKDIGPVVKLEKSQVIWKVMRINA